MKQTDAQILKDILMRKTVGGIEILGEILSVPAFSMTPYGQKVSFAKTLWKHQEIAPVYTAAAA